MLSLSAPPSLSVARGSSSTARVYIDRDFDGAVRLSLTGLPYGVSGGFDPNPVDGNAADLTLSVSAVSGTPGSDYLYDSPIPIRILADGLASTEISLVITPAAERVDSGPSLDDFVYPGDRPPGPPSLESLTRGWLPNAVDEYQPSVGIPADTTLHTNDIFGTNPMNERRSFDNPFDSTLPMRWTIDAAPPYRPEAAQYAQDNPSLTVATMDAGPGDSPPPAALSPLLLVGALAVALVVFD